MLKRFFCQGLESGTLLRRPARGYDRSIEKISLTGRWSQNVAKVSWELILFKQYLGLDNRGLRLTFIRGCPNFCRRIGEGCRTRQAWSDTFTMEGGRSQRLYVYVGRLSWFLRSSVGDRLGTEESVREDKECSEGPKTSLIHAYSLSLVIYG